MTVIAAGTTYGIDTKIKMIQTYLNSNLSWIAPQVYGRIYRNLKRVGDADVVIPEVYVSSKEYSQIFINDRQNTQIGFDIVDREVNPYSAEVDIIFTGNLDKIYGSSSLRLDEKAVIEAKRVLDDSGLVTVEDVKYGIAEVFAAFNQSQIKHRDMHPYFVFSYNCIMPYTEDYCK